MSVLSIISIVFITAAVIIIVIFLFSILGFASVPLITLLGLFFLILVKAIEYLKPVFLSFYNTDSGYKIFWGICAAVSLIGFLKSITNIVNHSK